MVGGKKETKRLLTKRTNILKIWLFNETFTVLTICDVFVILLIII